MVLSAIPVGIIVSLERAQPATHVYHYHSSGWFRECAKWDSDNHRFIVSYFEGGVGQISVPENEKELQGRVLEEVRLVKETQLGGNASVGLTIDRNRNRVLVVNADVLGNRYGALVAYDLSTWNRLFLTQLSGPSKLFLFIAPSFSFMFINVHASLSQRFYKLVKVTCMFQMEFLSKPSKFVLKLIAT